MDHTSATPARPALLISYERWWRTTNRSMKTVENYRYAIERFAHALWADQHGPDEAPTPRQLDGVLLRATKPDIVAWQAGRMDQVSAATVSVDIRGIRSFYAWLHAEGDIDANPAEKVKGPRVDEVPVPVAAESDYVALLATCRKGWAADRRDAAIIAMLWHGGFRRGELCVIDIAHVDLDAGTVTVVKTKGKRPRIVKLHPEVISFLDRYLRQHDVDKGPLFVSQRNNRLSSNGIGQMMHRRCEVAGITISPHAFRRAFAVRWREGGGSTSGLMAHAGWKSEAMVRRYSRMDAERLAQLEYEQLFNG